MPPFQYNIIGGCKLVSLHKISPFQVHAGNPVVVVVVGFFFFFLLGGGGGWCSFSPFRKMFVKELLKKKRY